jgi:repressor LexA
MTIYDRIDLKIAENGTTKKKMCTAIDLSYNTLMGFYRRKSENISLDTLKKIAVYLNTTLDYLIDGVESSSMKSNNGINKIPVLGVVPCGDPADAIEHVIGFIDNFMIERSDNAFALIAKGDSMEPVITEGDIIVVNKQNTVKTGDIAIVKVNGNDATCKKVIISASGISLVPTNENYNLVFYTKAQMDSEPISVIGKVIEVRKRF